MATSNREVKQLTNRSDKQKPDQSQKPKPGILRHLFSILGPGVIAGAADDDPSGIVTYSICRRTTGNFPLVDSPSDLAVDGHGPSDVRANRHGNGKGAGGIVEEEISKDIDFDGCDCIAHREYH
jgi:hypothetical protein